MPGASMAVPFHPAVSTPGAEAAQGLANSDSQGGGGRRAAEARRGRAVRSPHPSQGCRASGGAAWRAKDGTGSGIGHGSRAGGRVGADRSPATVLGESVPCYRVLLVLPPADLARVADWLCSCGRQAEPGRAQRRPRRLARRRGGGAGGGGAAAERSIMAGPRQRQRAGWCGAGLGRLPWGTLGGFRGSGGAVVAAGAAAEQWAAAGRQALGVAASRRRSGLQAGGHPE